MQAVAAELAGYAGKPPPLFELRRVRKDGKSRAIAKRRRIPLLFGEESLKQFVSMLMGLRVLKQMPSGLIRKPRKISFPTLCPQHFCGKPSSHSATPELLQRLTS